MKNDLHKGSIASIQPIFWSLSPMEDFARNCHDSRPNITYLAIGCAYNEGHGYQQHPPFLTNMMKSHPEFSYQIILIDPAMENPPEIVKTFGLKEIDHDWYGNTNVNVHVIRECFEYNKVFEKKCQSVSRNFLLELVNRTIKAKHQAPNNTYLFFMHDFSGYNISEFSERVYAFYQKYSEELYRKNVLIDLNNKIEASCFPDMNKFYFYPKLIRSSNGSLEIFNPFLLDNFDIYTIVLQNYRDGIYKLLVAHVLNHRLEAFARNILIPYRQVRTILEKKDDVSLEVDDIPLVLMQELNVEQVFTALFAKADLDGVIVGQMTENLLEELHLIMAWMDFIPDPNPWDEIFLDFIDECNKSNLDNPYQLTNIFRASQTKLQQFVQTVDPSVYLEDLENQTVQYTIGNKRLPLYLQLHIQDK